MDAAIIPAPAVSFDSVSTQASARLLKACVASFLLHLALLVGIPVNTAGGLPQTATILTARLEPAAPDNEPQTESVELVAEPASAPVPPVNTAQKPPEPKPQAKPEPTRPPEPSAAPSSSVELRDPTYYPVKLLDAMPKTLADYKPVYPQSAANAKVSGGSVVLLFLVDEFGVVNDLSVASAEPQGYFEEAALAAFREARFTPPTKQGRAVKTRFMIRVNFLDETSAPVR